MCFHQIGHAPHIAEQSSSFSSHPPAVSAPSKMAVHLITDFDLQRSPIAQFFRINQMLTNP